MKFLTLTLALLPSLVLSAPFQVKRDGSSLPNPLNDPFYKVPPNISDYSAGQVIQKRDVETNIEGSNVASSYQLSYRSLTTKQEPDSTVATIWTPSKPASPVKIFSYQVYEDAVGLSCAPSWAFTKGTNSTNTFPVSVDTPIYINYALSQGWYVVAADHEGSQSAFISGRQQGQAVLDGVRALINQEKLPSDSQIGLLGYSGGASATVWSENLAGSYAPELNLVGSAHGGTPIDALDTFNLLEGSLFAGFAGAGLVGLTNAYPELDAFVQSNINAAGKASLAKYRESGFCLTSEVGQNAFVNFENYFNIKDPLSAQVPKAVLAQETLLVSSAADPSQVSTPTFPRFIFHGLLDGIVPYSDVKTYVKQQCDSGANIAFNTVLIGEHILTEILGLLPAIDFITKALNGKAPKVFCGTSIPNISLHSQKAKEMIGSDGVSKLLNLNGTKDAFGQTIDIPQDA